MASGNTPGLTQEANDCTYESTIDSEYNTDVFDDMKQRFLTFKKLKYMDNLEHYKKLADAQAPQVSLKVSLVVLFVEYFLLVSTSFMKRSTSVDHGQINVWCLTDVGASTILTIHGEAEARASFLRCQRSADKLRRVIEIWVQQLSTNDSSDVH